MNAIQGTANTPQHPHQNGPGRRHMSLRVLSMTLLAATVLTACKLEIRVPEGGRVVAASGAVCAAEERCDIDVTDDSFTDTFVAEPDEGFTFKHWKKAQKYLCGAKSTPCELTTSAFAGNALLLGILDSDQVFYLEPVFEEAGRYDAAIWAQYLDEIDDGEFTGDGFLYQTRPNPGQCDPGALTNGATARAQDMVNLVRALHRLPPVDYDDGFDSQTQASSLVQRANNYLNHFPAPEDACFSAEALEGSSTSNLNAASVQTDPANDVLSWTNDNRNAADLMKAGHRRWVLFPELGFVSYGQVEGYSALKMFGFNQASPQAVPADLEYVAFPYMTYPYVLVSGGDFPTPWSISMVPDQGSGKFDYFASAEIEITDIESGEQLGVEDVHRDTDGFGLANFLSWMVVGWDYDVAYQVVISDVRMPSGERRDVEYEVLLDRYNLLDIEEPLEGGDSRSGTTLSGRFDSADDRDSYTLKLQGDEAVSGRSNFSNQAFYVLVYDERKRLVNSEDGAFTLAQPAGTYTVVVSPCNEAGRCWQGVTEYTVSFQ